MRNSPHPIETRIQALRANLLEQDAERLAALTGARHTSEGLHLALWDRAVLIGIPDFIARDPQTSSMLSPDVQALLLYYLNTSDGAAETGQWVSFSELPDGRFYTQAFQGYTGHRLAKAFNSDQAAFTRAASLMQGHPHPLGDSAFAFQALPHVTLLIVHWQGDEDFPPSFQVLFDATVSHHLPTDVCAILGSMLTRKLIAAQRT
jgi:hypothetical protein